MKRFPSESLIKAMVVVTGLLLLAACRMTPHANVGVDMNYYNGSFHVNPNAHIGISGKPDKKKH